MDLSLLDGLVEEWREEADLLLRRGATGPAEALESAAEELEERLHEWKMELLTLEQAARETGKAYDTVQKKVASGEWQNAGEKGSPLVRRYDIFPDLDPPGPRETSDPVEALADEVLRSRGGSG